MDELNFTFKMPDDETLAKYISIKGEKGESGDPTKLSQLENDTGFVTASTDALTNYYKKADTYTKAETDNLIDSVSDEIDALNVPDGFFDSTETVSGEGSAITLNDTANSAFKTIRLYGDTSQTGTPTPDSPIDIQVVTGDQTITVNDYVEHSQNYKVQLGKNLLNIADGTSTSNGVVTTVTDGLAEIKGKVSESWGFNIKAMKPFSSPLKANTTYVFSLSKTVDFRIRLNPRDANGDSLGNYSINAGSLSVSFTPSVDVAYYTLWSDASQNTSIDISELGFQIEKGSQATSYSSYVKPIELCKLGEGKYQDYIHKAGNRWYKHKEVGKATITSLSNITGVDASLTNTTRVNFSGVLNPTPNGIPASDRLFSKSNRFNAVSNYNVDTVGIYFANGTSGDTWIRVDKETIGTSTSTVREWLETNPVELYYPLNTPVEEEILDGKQISQLNALLWGNSYEDSTDISVAGSLPASLYVEAFKNTFAGTAEGILTTANSNTDKIIAQVSADNATLNVDYYKLSELDDATEKIQELIDYAIESNLVLNFPNKRFNISSIDFKTSKATFDDTVFVVNGSGEETAIKFTSPYKGCEYRNFTLEGNGNTGIEIIEAQNLLLDHIKVNNCKVGIDVIGKYEVTICNSLIKNDYDIVDSVGLIVHRSDNVFSNIVIQGFRTGVQTTQGMDGTYFDKIHIWSTVEDTVINSIGFDLYNGADLRDCYFDTCRIGVKIRNSGRGIRLNNCRWFWNTNYYTDAILDGAETLLFDFADSDCTTQLYMDNCFGYKPSTVTEVKFSNIAVANWKSLCNVQGNNKSMFNFTDVPYGVVSSLETPSDFTDVTNKVIATESGVNIDYVGEIASNATTGLITLGYLSDAQFLPLLPLNTSATYGTQWSAPEGFVYVYINQYGKVEARITNAMLGKYLKIHIAANR